MVDYIKKETDKYQRGLFILLIFAIIILSAFYIYSVGNIVMETVRRDKNLEDLQISRQEFQELEKTYLNLLSKFNLEYARSLGFISGNAVAFISKTTQMAQNNSYEKTIR